MTLSLRRFSLLIPRVRCRARYGSAFRGGISGSWKARRKYDHFTNYQAMLGDDIDCPSFVSDTSYCIRQQRLIPNSSTSQWYDWTKNHTVFFILLPQTSIAPPKYTCTLRTSSAPADSGAPSRRRFLAGFWAVYILIFSQFSRIYMQSKATIYGSLRDFFREGGVEN